MPFAAVRDDDSAPFFDALAEGTLLVRRCHNDHRLPPYLAHGQQLRSCPTCGSVELSWAAASGAGTLVSWTIIPGEPAQTSGIVELAEGPWIYAGLDVPGDQLAEGLPVMIGIARPDGGEPVPVFHLQQF